MTAGALVHECAARLQAAGIEAAAWDAERLVRHVLGWDRATFFAHGDDDVPPALERRVRDLVERRAGRTPLQHLLGFQAFWKHEFVVTPDVLIPRPETERVVEASLACLQDLQAPTIVDVGTGSGCIALSLAAERGDAFVHATDLSGAALAVARQNADSLGVGQRVRFHEGDLLDPVAYLAGRLDLVVSNPPYVDELDADTLAPEVRDHEPPLALYAPGGGSAVYRRLVPAAAALLAPGGHLVLEIGHGQQPAIESICAAAGLRVDAVRPDLAGIPRALVASLPGRSPVA